MERKLLRAAFSWADSSSVSSTTVSTRLAGTWADWAGLVKGEWYEVETEDCVVEGVRCDRDGVLAREAKEAIEFEEGAKVKDTEATDDAGEEWTDGELGTWASASLRSAGPGLDGTKWPALGLRLPVVCEATDSGGDGGARSGMGVAREECGEEVVDAIEKYARKKAADRDRRDKRGMRGDGGRLRTIKLWCLR